MELGPTNHTRAKLDSVPLLIPAGKPPPPGGGDDARVQLNQRNGWLPSTIWSPVSLVIMYKVLRERCLHLLRRFRVCNRHDVAAILQMDVERGGTPLAPAIQRADERTERSDEKCAGGRPNQ
jgi:hypothetical protein